MGLQKSQHYSQGVDTRGRGRQVKWTEKEECRQRPMKAVPMDQVGLPCWQNAIAIAIQGRSFRSILRSQHSMKHLALGRDRW